MADSTYARGGNNNALHFIVGAMLLAIVMLGIMFFHGNLGGGSSDKVDITIQTPKVEAPKTQ